MEAVISLTVQRELGFLLQIPVNLICGGTQEFGLRGGTESFPAIASMITTFKDTETKIDNIEEEVFGGDNFENQILKKFLTVKF